MLDRDALAEVEGDAEWIYRSHGFDPDEPAPVAALCQAMTGAPPEMATIRLEAYAALVAGSLRVFIRRGTKPERARWLVGHELAEVHYARQRYEGPDIEARCDALGAALVAPRRATLAIVRACGRDPRAVARVLKTTRSVAFLRVSEVTGEPAALVRESGPIVRGEPFVWPVQLSLPFAERARHPAVRRVQIRDEPRRIGLAPRDAA